MQNIKLNADIHLGIRLNAKENEGGDLLNLSTSTPAQSDHVHLLNLSKCYKEKQTNKNKDYFNETKVIGEEQSQKFLNNVLAVIKRKLVLLANKHLLEYEDIPRLASEVLHHVNHRSTEKTFSDEQAMNAAIKMIKAGRWQTPRSMTENIQSKH